MFHLGHKGEPRPAPFPISSGERTCGVCGETRYPNKVYDQNKNLVEVTCPDCGEKFTFSPARRR